MKRKILIILFSAVAVGALVFGVFGVLTCNQQKKIAQLEEHIDKLKAVQTPIRFKITERTDEDFEVALKYFDANDEVINRVEKKFKGSELSLDFVEFKVKDSYVAFPYKMYSDEIAPDDGYLMLNDYDKAGFPQIFYQKGLNPELKKGLQKLFENLKENKVNPFETYFGNMVHDLKGVKNYQTGVVYKVIVHTKGGIEVVED
jgi:hypothetical protein